MSTWGQNFRPDYRDLGSLRQALFATTTFYATSATLTDRIYDDVTSVLGMQADTTETIRIDTDRANLKYVRRALRYPQASYRDLDEAIPENIKCASDIPLTLIYFDSVRQAEDATTHLWTQLPRSMRGFDKERRIPRASRVITWYTALMSRLYKRLTMDDFCNGEIRILCCTDAAGMVGHPTAYVIDQVLTLPIGMRHT